jgi:hypothetical protein
MDPVPPAPREVTLSGGGRGGQSVNTNDQGVLLRALPAGPLHTQRIEVRL